MGGHLTAGIAGVVRAGSLQFATGSADFPWRTAAAGVAGGGYESADHNFRRLAALVNRLKWKDREGCTKSVGRSDCGRHGVAGVLDPSSSLHTVLTGDPHAMGVPRSC